MAIPEIILEYKEFSEIYTDANYQAEYILFRAPDGTGILTGKDNELSGLEEIARVNVRFPEWIDGTEEYNALDYDIINDLISKGICEKIEFDDDYQLDIVKLHDYECAC